MTTPIDRRQFVASTIASAAAWSWPGTTTAGERQAVETSGGNGIVDTHVYLGHWPHARLSGEDPRELVDQFRHGGIVRAWVGSFDGLFHKDIAAVNERLTSICSHYDELIPFGSVNPTLPDWEDDLRRCHETHRMAGIRLHPTYHGYQLLDARVSELLKMAAAANLIVQVVVWLDDAKHRWLAPAPEAQELKPTLAAAKNLNGKIRRTPERLVVAGAQAKDIPAWIAIFPQQRTCFDMTRAQTTEQLSSLLEQVPADRILFGTGEPLHTSAAQQTALKSLASLEHRNAIASRTARLLASKP